MTGVGAAQLALPLLDKRWRDRRERWVAPGDLFDPRAYAVDVVDDAEAIAYVERHHYAASCPPTQLCVGLHGPGRAGRSALVGVAVFSVGIVHAAAARKYCGRGPAQVAELGRLVCDPSVRFNGESWMIARAFAALAREKGARAVYSYADPLERRDAAGQLTKGAHWGTIYQATNALHVGRSSPRTLYLTRQGRALSGRALTKIRKQEAGCDYAAAQLRAATGVPRAAGEAPDAWVRRALRAGVRSGAVRRVRHPGNLVYAFGLDGAERAALHTLHGGGRAYPRRTA